MKYAKNTIGYWLSKLPKGEREKALRYAKDKVRFFCDSTHEAIDLAFWWEQTTEGFQYWLKIYSREHGDKYTRVRITIANPSTFRIDSVNPFTVSWEE